MPVFTVVTRVPGRGAAPGAGRAPTPWFGGGGAAGVEGVVVAPDTGGTPAE
jgi:hypothetical protein